MDHPYRNPGEIEVPRPIEIQFKVSLFVRGGATPVMDAPLRLAEDFEEYLDGQLVNVGEDFAQRSVLAVEVKPFEQAVKEAVAVAYEANQ